MCLTIYIPVFFHPAVVHCETHTRLYLFEALAEMWIEIGVKLGNINFHFSDVNCVVLRAEAEAFSIS